MLGEWKYNNLLHNFPRTRAQTLWHCGFFAFFAIFSFASFLLTHWCFSISVRQFSFISGCTPHSWLSKFKKNFSTTEKIRPVEVENRHDQKRKIYIEGKIPQLVQHFGHNFHQESVLQKKVSRTIKKSISHANTPTRIQLQRKWFFFKCSLSCTENSVKLSHYIIHQHSRWPVSQLSKHRELYSFLLLTERGRARVINSFIDHWKIAFTYIT